MSVSKNKSKEIAPMKDQVSIQELQEQVSNQQSYKKWWKECVVYQIYPRSFKDSNGDGIGDFSGILAKLDYIASVGANVLCLCSIFDSPNDNIGYDIRDYRTIHPDFGTLEDFEALVETARKKGLKIILDLPINHTSTRHVWFQAAQQNPNSPYRNYYHWKRGENGKPPNNWQSFFVGNAWTKLDGSDDYYLHLFSKTQVDLNWENPQVRQEIYRIMRFWLDKGIAGFRLDGVSFISKNLDLPNHLIDNRHLATYYANGPQVHQYLQEMHQELLKEYDVMMVGEGLGIDLKNAPKYVSDERKELQMVYPFDLLEIDRPKNDFYGVRMWNLLEFKHIVNKWNRLSEHNAWNAIMLGNHDFPRMLSRFGDEGTHRQASAKMLATFLLTQWGTPFLYQGDEIGMSNIRFNSVDDYKDVWVKNAYEKLKKYNVTESAFLKAVYTNGRDNARTPFQWSDEANAGFSDKESWMSVNANYEYINVKDEQKDANSILNYYKKAVRLRKVNPTFVYGDYVDIDPYHETVFAYKRKLGDDSVLVVLNFSRKPTLYVLEVPYRFYYRSLLLCNYTDREEEKGPELSLRPYEARVYRLL